MSMYSLNVQEETPVNLYNLSNRPASLAALYRARLQSVTPHVFLSRILFFLNIAVYLVMACKIGTAGKDFTVDQLLAWGADYAPDTITNHQWWRLVVCAFLHGGLIHLGCNMFVLWQAGPFLERLFGNVGFLLIYFISAVGASLLSLAVHPYQVSVGASGAIFGLYGALLGFLLMQLHNIPRQVLSPLGTSAVTFVIYNLVFGSGGNVDAAAHLGGLISGFVCGLVLSVSIMRNPLPSRAIRMAILALVSVSIYSLTISRLPHHADIRVPLQHFAATEKAALAAFNDLIQRSRTGHLPDSQFADLLDQNVITPWRSASEPFAAMTNLPDPQRHAIETIRRYAGLREKAWSLFAQGLRKRDRSLLLAANAQQALADRTAAALIDRK